MGSGHWFLDLLVHRPDLPLSFGDSAKVGWGLWNSMAITLLLEYGLFTLGVLVYLRTTRPLDRIGRWAFWGLVAFLALGFASDVGGPPPPSVSALACMALALWLLVLWAWWMELISEIVRGRARGAGRAGQGGRPKEGWIAFQGRRTLPCEARRPRPAGRGWPGA
jgi:hypothetical protein